MPPSGATSPQARPPRPEAENGTAPSPATVAPELERLARSVSALEDDAGDPEHRRVTRSLRDAADALETLEPERAGAGDSLRSAADRIERSGADSLSHADALKKALAGAAERLSAHRAAAPRAEAMDAALAELEGGVESLNASRPLLEQQRIVSDSLRALGDALFLAAGHDAPFAGRAPRPRSTDEVMEQARADVLALGRADLSNIRELTSRAMYSMADLAEAVAGGGGSAPELAQIRAEARRLQQGSSGPFARAGWVERGLQAAISRLDQLDVCHASLVAEWTEAARRAAAKLPERGALPFQHASIQDAFRSTLDAFGAALLARQACESPARSSDRASAAANERSRER